MPVLIKFVLKESFSHDAMCTENLEVKIPQGECCSSSGKRVPVQWI